MPPSLSASAAGYLEGVLTAPRIYDNWRNMLDYFTDPQLGMNVSLEEPMKWWVH